MNENKTQPNDASVDMFLQSISDEMKRADAYTLLEMLSRITGKPPVMWGDSIIGFGSYHYHGASGREGDWFVTGFSPRKANLTLYLYGYLENYSDLLQRLGKYKAGKGCLYLKRLSDVDLAILEALLVESSKRASSAA